MVTELSPGEKLLLWYKEGEKRSRSVSSKKIYPGCFHCNRTFTKEDKANYVWMCPSCNFSQHSLALNGIHHDEYTEEGEIHTKNFATGECIIRSI